MDSSASTPDREQKTAEGCPNYISNEVSPVGKSTGNQPLIEFITGRYDCHNPQKGHSRLEFASVEILLQKSSHEKARPGVLNQMEDLVCEGDTKIRAGQSRYRRKGEDDHKADQGREEMGIYSLVGQRLTFLAGWYWSNTHLRCSVFYD